MPSAQHVEVMAVWAHSLPFRFTASMFNSGRLHNLIAARAERMPEIDFLKKEEIAVF